MQFFRSNDRYVPVNVLVAEDVRNPWEGHDFPRQSYMDLPRSQDEAVRLAKDWTFTVQEGASRPYREAIPVGSRVWLHRPGNIAVANIIAAEVPASDRQ